MSNETEAPERIWVTWPHPESAGLAFCCQARPPATRHPYTRADLSDVKDVGIVEQMNADSLAENHVHLKERIAELEAIDYTIPTEPADDASQDDWRNFALDLINVIESAEKVTTKAASAVLN